MFSAARESRERRTNCFDKIRQDNTSLRGTQAKGGSRGGEGRSEKCTYMGCLDDDSSLPSLD